MQKAAHYFDYRSTEFHLTEVYCRIDHGIVCEPASGLSAQRQHVILPVIEEVTGVTPIFLASCQNVLSDPTTTMPTEPSAFSTSDESAITRTIDVKPDTTADQLSTEEFDNFYEIQRTAAEIIEGDYKRVRFTAI